MATVTKWNFGVGGAQHEVELEHGKVSGNRTIRLDGHQVEDDQRFLDFGSSHELDVDGHQVTLKIKMVKAGFSHDYELHVDGQEVPPVE
jgi:hypothetical protein